MGLAAIRFVKALVKKKDDAYDRHVVQFHVMKPLLELFKRNGDRYNMINSAIIDFFSVLLQQNKHLLISHVVENHWSYVEDVTYVSTFQDMLNKYQKRTKFEAGSGNEGAVSGQPADRESTEEDRYFGEDDDDEDEDIAAPGRGSSLVDSMELRIEEEEEAKMGQGLKPLRGH